MSNVVLNLEQVEELARRHCRSRPAHRTRPIYGQDGLVIGRRCAGTADRDCAVGWNFMVGSVLHAGRLADQANG
jgi:hypothetical protein